MDDSKWDSYFKFCFVRNPYDRIVSGWNYICETQLLSIDFDKYVKLQNVVSDYEYSHTFLPQSTHIFTGNDESKIYMDYLGKFECLEEEFVTILKRIGFNDNEIVHNPEIKLNARGKSKTKTKNVINNNKILHDVNKIYEEDFKHLHYNKLEQID
jgi:hypothetical protein